MNLICYSYINIYLFSFDSLKHSKCYLDGMKEGVKENENKSFDKENLIQNPSIVSNNQRIENYLQDERKVEEPEEVKALPKVEEEVSEFDNILNEILNDEPSSSNNPGTADIISHGYVAGPDLRDFNLAKNKVFEENKMNPKIL